MIRYFLLTFMVAGILSGASPEGYKIETVDIPPQVKFHVTGLDVAADGTVY